MLNIITPKTAITINPPMTPNSTGCNILLPNFFASSKCNCLRNYSTFGMTSVRPRFPPPSFPQFPHLLSFPISLRFPTSLRPPSFLRFLTAVRSLTLFLFPTFLRPPSYSSFLRSHSVSLPLYFPRPPCVP